MSTLDFDLDMQMDNLEQEWRQGYEAGIAARAAYQSLAASATTDAELTASGPPAAGARRSVEGEYHGENKTSRKQRAGTGLRQSAGKQARGTILMDRHAMDLQPMWTVTQCQTCWSAVGSRRGVPPGPMQSECAVLREVVDQAEAAWRRARRQLETLENVCDVLAEDYYLHNEVRLPSFATRLRCPPLIPFR